jgi:renalase
MTLETGTVHVAVIGSGLAGSACAAGLRRAGAQVTVFEKAQTVGGRAATRRAGWIDASGAEQSVTFDDSTQHFTSAKRHFKPAVARAMAAGVVSAWRPRVHGVWPFELGQCLAASSMPSLCSHLLGDTTVHSNYTVRRLQRTGDGSWYVASDGMPLSGSFHHVVMALPPAQAAVLLAGHQDKWADVLMAKRIEPCWTLTAVTDDVDWPWDAAQIDRGPLSWVLRNDRVPGRAMPPGLAVWTVHATAEWSAAHADDDQQALIDKLQSALQARLPTSSGGNGPASFHYANVHRGRYPGSPVDCSNSIGSNGVWWDESLGLGVCGNFLGDGGLEAAWYSGDELAHCMAVSFELTEKAGCEGAALSKPARAALHIHLPLTDPQAVIHEATLELFSLAQGEASKFSVAGLKSRTASPSASAEPIDSSTERKL